MVITALTRNQVVQQWARGFESHRFRQIKVMYEDLNSYMTFSFSMLKSEEIHIIFINMRKEKNVKITYKYSSTRSFSIGFAVLICIGFLLTLTRWYSIFNNDFVIINSEIHSHISNLSLSLIAYLGIGYSWLLLDVKFRFIAILGMAMIAGNFICETLMGFMNTPDIIDAIYGTMGIVVAFLFLAITKKYGLMPTNPEKL